MSASFRQVVDDAGLALVCDLPEASGYRRWFVVGHLPKASRDLVTHEGLDLGDTAQAQAHAQAAGVGHGA